MSDVQSENRLSDRRTAEQIGWLVASIVSLAVYQVAMKLLYWDLHQEQGLAEPVTWLTPLVVIFLVVFILYFEAGWTRILLVSLAVVACGVFSVFQAKPLMDSIFVNKTVLFDYEISLTVILFGLYALGLVAMWLLSNTIPAPLMALFGLPVGCSIWAIASALIFYAGIACRVWSVGGLVLVLLVLRALSRPPRRPDRTTGVQLGLYTLVYIGAAIVVPFLFGTLLADGSVSLIKIGENLNEGRMGLTSLNMVGERAMIGLFLPFLTAMIRGFGSTEVNIFIPMLFVAFLSLLAYEMGSILTTNGQTRRRWLPIVLTVVLLVSSGTIVKMGAAHLSDGPMLALVLAFLAVLRTHRKEDHAVYPIIGGLLLAAMLLMRAEMSIVVPMLVLLAAASRIPLRSTKILLAIPAVLYVVIVAGTAVHLSGMDWVGSFPEQNRLDFMDVLPGLIAFVVAGLLLLPLSDDRLQRFRPILRILPVLLLIGLVVVFAILEPTQTQETFRLLVQQALFSENGGLGWHALIWLFPMVFLIVWKQRLTRTYSTYLWVACLLPLAMTAAQLLLGLPEEVDAATQADRILAFSFPFLAAHVFIILAPMLGQDRKQAGKLLDLEDDVTLKENMKSAMRGQAWR